MHPADIIIVILLALAVVYALRQIIKNKGSCGCAGCSGNCGDCKSACSKRKE